MVVDNDLAVQSRCSLSPEIDISERRECSVHEVAVRLMKVGGYQYPLPAKYSVRCTQLACEPQPTEANYGEPAASSQMAGMGQKF